LINETYITQLKEQVQKNPEAKFYICLRIPPADIRYETGKIEKCIDLSPSENLSRDYRGKLINWTGFVTKFYKEMRSPKCAKLIQFMKLESIERDIYLVCSCGPSELNKCHRFILLDLINNL
jgi:uncharacterized protein YeaO (DUF488 family)